MSALLGPAVPLGLDSGLSDVTIVDDTFAELIEDLDMTVDSNFDWSMLEVPSDFSSPHDCIQSSTASDWAKSPGKQSQQNSHTGASSSRSPGTASLILTPTSSTLPDFLGDAAPLDEAEASDSTSPDSSFSSSSSSGGYVDVGHSAGQTFDGPNVVMNNRPQPSSGSGVARSSSHHPRTAMTAPTITAPRAQLSSFPSTSSTGAWMDQQGAHWGGIDQSFDSYLNATATSNNGDIDDILTNFTPINHATTRESDPVLPFRVFDNDSQAFVQTPYEQFYTVPQQTQQLPQAHAISNAQSAYAWPVRQHGFQYGSPFNTVQPQAQYSFAPTLPSQRTPPVTQPIQSNVFNTQGQQSTRTSVSSSPTFASGPARHVAPQAPYTQHAAVQNSFTQSSASTQQQQHHLNVPSNAAAIALARRALQPAAPGSSRLDEGSSTQTNRRRGGRAKNTRLADGVRQKSHQMRKTGACWRCVMQRDSCEGDGMACDRCINKAHKGQLTFLECDRSKLPDLVHDFLPPSMTGMHQKQSIEDYTAEKIARWDENNSIDIYLTCGYGPALPWKMYEFMPKDEEPIWQLQYVQDPATGRQCARRKYSPPFGLMKLDTSDDAHFESYMQEMLKPNYLWDFGWTCFEEETQVDDFQARLLQAMCTLSTSTQDVDLQQLLSRVLRMMIITYIMGHTLTMSEGNTYGVFERVKMSEKPPHAKLPTQHVSPRLANRQLKFFFHVLRERVYIELLNWQQQTMHGSSSKSATWLPAFCVTLGLAMVLEEVERTLWIQADAKARKEPNVTMDQANTEAANACDRIDGRFKLLVGLFQCKYRDRKWSVGSFGNGTPKLQDMHANNFLREVRSLLIEKRMHLETRKDIGLSSENQCYYTSRLVARFLLPFLDLPA